jgi:hypothetical protein
MPDEPKVEYIDQKPTINSHTQTEYGKYDADEPLPFESNAYGWYLRACYWKQKFHRNEGIQQAINFGETQETRFLAQAKKYHIPHGSAVPLHVDLDELAAILKPTFPSTYANKINGIKYVRDQSALGLTESKDFVDHFMTWNSMEN